MKIDKTNYQYNFNGIKMTTASRKDGTRLLQEYLDKPSLDLRDTIFEIMDPYMQRFAKKIATEGYYYDDVLQNMRLNLFAILDREQLKKADMDRLSQMIKEATAQSRWKYRGQLIAEYKKIPPILDTIKKIKNKLFHYTDHTEDAKIPQMDENLVSWNRLNYMEQEKLIPAEKHERQDIIEHFDDIYQNARITDYEKAILYYVGKEDLTLQEIAKKFNLTVERVRQIREKAIRRIRMQFGIDKKHVEKPQTREVWKLKAVEQVEPDENISKYYYGRDPEVFDIMLGCNHFIKVVK